MNITENNTLGRLLRRSAAVVFAVISASCANDVSIYNGADAAKLRLSVGQYPGKKLSVSTPPQMVIARGRIEKIDGQQVGSRVELISTSVASLKPGDHDITVRFSGTQAFSSSMATRVHLKAESTYRLYLRGAFIARDFVLHNEDSGEDTHLVLRDLGVQRN